MRSSVIVVLLLILSCQAVAEEAPKVEPLRTLSLCLIMNKWSSWGIWQLEIYALANDKILIGDKHNHFLIAADQNGYRHVIDGEVVANYPQATGIDSLGAACGVDCPPSAEQRVAWFKRRCRSY